MKKLAPIMADFSDRSCRITEPPNLLASTCFYLIDTEDSLIMRHRGTKIYSPSN